MVSLIKCIILHRAMAEVSEVDGYKIVGELSDEMLCPVTTGLLLQPHLTSCCGNHLSLEATNRIKEENKACPLCNTSTFTTVLNKHFQRKVKSLRVYCCHKERGCEWEGELANYKWHIRSCPKKDMALRKEDLFTVHNELYDARAKWRIIGLGLKISPVDLDVIDQDKASTEEKLEAVIYRWLNNAKDCTWSKLSQVLSARSVGKDKLAEEIRKKYAINLAAEAATSLSQPLPQARVKVSESADKRSRVSQAQASSTIESHELQLTSECSDPGQALIMLAGNETEKATAAETEEKVKRLFSHSSIQPAGPLSDLSGSPKATESSSTTMAKPQSNYEDST